MRKRRHVFIIALSWHALLYVVGYVPVFMCPYASFDKVWKLHAFLHGVGRIEGIRFMLFRNLGYKQCSSLPCHEIIFSKSFFFFFSFFDNFDESFPGSYLVQLGNIIYVAQKL